MRRVGGTRRNGRLAFAALWLLGFAAVVNAGQDQPAFRAGVDLIQLDVSVLDDSRQPVRGLRAADFVVTIDDNVRPVSTFKAVDLAPRPVADASAAPWVRDVAPDVATNADRGGRIIGILIDDFNIAASNLGPRGLMKTRQIAKAVVDALGPDDRAAVLFTANAHTAQNFTSDRRLLYKAIDDSAISPSARLAPFCFCGACSLEVLGDVSKGLRDLTDQRKILVFVSAGPVVFMPRAPLPGLPPPPDPVCNSVRRAALHRALREALFANVTIQTIDPKGLETGMIGGFATPATLKPRGGGAPIGLNPMGQLENPAFVRIENMRAIAGNTGGRAVVHNNDMELEVPALLAETSSYYLIGVEAPAPKGDGHYHGIDVRVNRPGVEVRARNGYYEPTADERKTLEKAAVASDLPLAIAGALPGGDTRLEVVAAPFATPDRKGELAIAIGVAPPMIPAQAGQARTEVVDLVASLFNPESGKRVGSRSTRASISWKPAEGPGSYEVLSRLPAAPGRYELRIGLKAEDGRTSSVYGYVEVPNFDREPFALSGLTVFAEPATLLVSRTAFDGWLPGAPTVRRVFDATESASAFLRVYQLGTRVSASATVTTRITDVRNAVVKATSTTVASPAAGAADYRYELPLRDLAAGEYLLTIDVAVRDKTAQRSVRFRVE